MTKFEEEFNYLIELSGKVLIGQVDAEAFEKNRIAFFEKYETGQQQALPVVPDFVGKWLDSNNLASLLDEWYCHHEDMSSHIREYFERLPYKGPNNLSEMENNIVTFITRAKLGGYKLEKPQLFYLKNKLTTSYLELDKTNDYFHHTMNPAPYYDMTRKSQFTQQEIDSMETGSYEQIEVVE